MSTFEHVKAKFETSIAQILQDLVFPGVVAYIREHPNPATISVGDLMNRMQLAYTAPVVVQSREPVFQPPPPPMQQFQPPGFQPKPASASAAAGAPGSQCLYRYPKGTKSGGPGTQCTNLRGTDTYFCSSHRKSKAAGEQRSAMYAMGFDPSTTNEAPPLGVKSQAVNTALSQTTGMKSNFAVSTPMNAQVRTPSFQPPPMSFGSFSPPPAPVIGGYQPPPPALKPASAGSFGFGMPGQISGPNLNGLTRTPIDIGNAPSGTFYKLIGDIASQELIFTDMNGVTTYVGRIHNGEQLANHTTSQGLFLESRNIPTAANIESVPDEDEDLEDVDEDDLAVPSPATPSFQPPPASASFQPPAPSFQPPPASASFQLPPASAQVSAAEVNEVSLDDLANMEFDEDELEE